MELFVGLDFPFAVNQELEQIQKRLRRFDPSGKYEPPENYHLTLRYIGELPEAESVTANLEPIECKRFRLRLHELGMFENPEKTVIWVNVTGENEALQTLQRRIDRTLTDAGVQVERFSFVPHISLAYDCRNSLSDYFSSCEVTPLSFEVSDFHLYVVHRSPEGSRFRKIRTFNLTE
ncbi:RNA 2',3'-cyclic phosphodiesterase [Cohnella massiliensis]|uniref:RNA 2',3'-cyclic phosphodiesterase n=1 Tax=Cohnella massiliensis TaxID=1816691 RepID=UPI0009BA7EBC|nr:RNA 2',3'-cyclic phosphodiesterase [Cohnella massiliensis]